MSDLTAEQMAKFVQQERNEIDRLGRLLSADINATYRGEEGTARWEKLMALVGNSIEQNNPFVIRSLTNKQLMLLTKLGCIMARAMRTKQLSLQLKQHDSGSQKEDGT